VEELTVKKKIPYLILILISVLSLKSYAGGFGCRGIPTEINAWHKTGYISAKLDNHDKVWLICNTIDNPGCNSVLSLLQTAKVTKTEVSLLFSDSNYTKCSDIPQWTPVDNDFNYIKLL
jgi:hypothetical protein